MLRLQKLKEETSGIWLRKETQEEEKTRVRFYMLDFFVGFFHLKEKQINDLDLT